ncbi:MAG: amidohydrolase family protein, partial [Chloroflexota bacterium]|nr:amidohydrolase family protein [Chloroflexota bacterium]
TLVTYSALAEEGRAFGLPQSSFDKVFDVLDAGLRALEMAHRAGVSIAYGTDLLGGMHVHQLRELTIRAQVQPAADILRSVTLVGARLLRMADRIGRVMPGMLADLLVIDGDPLSDLALLGRPECVPMIMKGGRVYRDRLCA